MRTPRRALGQTEFIFLLAMLAATVAISIDAMLPALPDIARDLTPDAPNNAQLVVTAFVFGLGLGTFFTGPLSDAYGRKPVMICGAVIFMLASLVAFFTSSFEIMLIARVVQGIGAAGPRIVALALVSDMYKGPQMARIMSFMMVVFTIVPALAPTMGAVIMSVFGWRYIFLTFVVFSLITIAWLGLRQPETLPAYKRRPMETALLRAAIREIFANATTRLSIIIQVLVYAMLFIVISSTQQVFDITFGMGDTFHYWFGAIAVLASSASILNARLVIRLGMRAIINAMFTAQIVLTTLLILITFAGAPYWLAFGIFVLWTAGSFFQVGLTIGNLNALAMEPMDHIAGMAASLIAAVATIGGVVLAAPVGLAFDGTPLPMAIGILGCASVALMLSTKIKRPGEV